MASSPKPQGTEREATLTADDHDFVRLAVQHYRVFAEVAERAGDARTTGILRAQEFHAQMFKERLDEVFGRDS